MAWVTPHHPPMKMHDCPTTDHPRYAAAAPMTASILADCGSSANWRFRPGCSLTEVEGAYILPANLRSALHRGSAYVNRAFARRDVIAVAAARTHLPQFSRPGLLDDVVRGPIGERLDGRCRLLSSGCNKIAAIHDE